MAETTQHYDDAFEESLKRQDTLNAQMGLDDPVANLAITNDEDRKLLEVMLEKHIRGIEPLPKDDFTVQAAVNALIMEQKGYSTDELDENEKPTEVDTSNIETALTSLSERYLSVDAMNKVFEKLQGVNVQIPAKEVARLKTLLPAEITDENREAINRLKNACEDNAAPLIMQLPQIIIIDGEEKPFTIATMYEIMQKAAKAGSIKKPMWLSDYVTKATKDQKWSSELGVWSATCLEGSKDKRYRGNGGQLEHQKEILGENHEIHADMILAMALRYIQNGEELMISDFMRLNDTDSDGDPLDVAVDGDGLALDDSDDGADHVGGIGASFRISS